MESEFVNNVDNLEFLVPFAKNEDYQILIKTLNKLKIERSKCINDINILNEMKNTALGNPHEFAKNLLLDNSVHFPQRIAVSQCPVIDWSFYKDYCISHDIISTNQQNVESAENENIRKWTTEEQEKLERLLITYPPEEIESKRWLKISQHLPNRTPRQVASRVQKYFIKLAKAGLPIPGRAPTVIPKKRKSKLNIARFKNSSFFPSWNPQIVMKNDSDDSKSLHGDSNNVSIQNQVDNLSEKAKSTQKYQTLLNLIKLKQESLKMLY